MTHIRKATEKDLSRIAEILVFVKRINFRPIFQDDDYSFGELQVLTVAEEYRNPDILNHVWGESYYGDEKVVDVNMRRLRMKIEDEPSLPKHLVTVWGMGYKWN